jgi:hypothetical protein
MTMDQIIAIPNPANGLQVFCSTDSKYYIYMGATGQWKELVYGSGAISPTLCGSSFTVNHVAGDVAPVTKTVTYGTVTNVPGEPTKCWITRNLGASQQAVSVFDVSEASAGWYWQFNRKQGYQNDGASIVPVWNTLPVGENVDWKASNDPCTIELGSAWHIPSRTEWYNVDNAGNWATWTGIYASPLRMHAAGFLSSNGDLSYRGEVGDYWSGNQTVDMLLGEVLRFDSENCGVGNFNKVNGSTIRCLRE